MSTVKTVNVGVVGCGFMGATHLKAYRKIPRARIAAICDAYRLPPDGDFSRIGGNVGNADGLKLNMSVVKGYEDYRRLLDDPEIELVDVCTPTASHPEVVIAALRAGKHVVCEKPMARASALCREMADAARESKRFLMPAMCLRFWPEWVWVKKAIAAGTYGRVLAARFRRVAEPPGWSAGTFLDGKQSGGALLDLHIHDADFVQFCFGRPRSVFSRGYVKVSGAIDHVVTQYEVNGGAIVHAEGGWAMAKGFGFNMAYTVNFERATADYDLAKGADALRLFAEGNEPRTVKCDGADAYLAELEHMVDSICTGRPPTVVTAEDGLSAVEICEAEEQSIRSGRSVELQGGKTA